MSEKSTLEITVQQISSGKRLDAFLASYTRMEGISRSATRTGIEAGLVLLNGRIETSPTKRLRYGDTIVSAVVAVPPVKLFPNDKLDMPVIYEDDDILVIAKPAGVQMHPAGNDKTETVANWIAATHTEMLSVGDDSYRPGIVHRLDRNTSGVVVLAKNAASFLILKDNFQSRRTQKTYLALVIGHVKENSGTIEYPLAHEAGTLRRRAIKDPDSFQGETRDAVTEYSLNERYAEYDLLNLFPKTGRTHQLRVHLAAIGHPVAGDRLYGGRRMMKESAPERQLLHAFRLEFPFREKTYSFEAPVPSDFIRYISAIDGNEKPGYPVEASDGQGEA